MTHFFQFHSLSEIQSITLNPIFEWSNFHSKIPLTRQRKKFKIKPKEYIYVLVIFCINSEMHIHMKANLNVGKPIR